MEKVWFFLNRINNRMETVYFDSKKFNMLKKAYNKALFEGSDTFIFEGREILTTYAKYMLKYLSGTFEKV